MKIPLRTDAFVSKDFSRVLSPVKVCMHVLGTARNDVRVMRSATALAEAGYKISIIISSVKILGLPRKKFVVSALNMLLCQDGPPILGTLIHGFLSERW
jgi:hypothetical protein